MNSLGPELAVPLPLARLLVFLVLNRWEFIHDASWERVTLPEAYRRNNSLTAYPFLMDYVDLAGVLLFATQKTVLVAGLVPKSKDPGWRLFDALPSTPFRV